MSSNRTILSRPRTRLYDANYNIGESYYKSALDNIDRKYSGRSSLSTTPTRLSSIPRDILERHEKAFENDDLTSSRKRAEKLITESNIFDTRSGYLQSTTSTDHHLENDIDEETASALTRIRANKKNISTQLEDIDLDSTYNNIKSKRLLNRSEKLLDTVGINDNTRKILNEEITIKRKIKEQADLVKNDLTKWTSIDNVESAASIRAKETKNRLQDIEDEMICNAEKQAARERRAARFKALVAETNNENFDNDTTHDKFKSISVRKEKRSVHF